MLSGPVATVVTLYISACWALKNWYAIRICVLEGLLAARGNPCCLVFFEISMIFKVAQKRVYRYRRPQKKKRSRKEKKERKRKRQDSKEERKEQQKASKVTKKKKKGEQKKKSGPPTLYTLTPDRPPTGGLLLVGRRQKNIYRASAAGAVMRSGVGRCVGRAGRTSGDG